LRRLERNWQMAMRAKGTIEHLTRPPNATSGRLVDRYLTLSATRPSSLSLTAYRTDLLDLARFLSTQSIVASARTLMRGSTRIFVAPIIPMTRAAGARGRRAASTTKRPPARQPTRWRHARADDAPQSAAMFAQDCARRRFRTASC
jgi:hypothetical protein